MKARPQKSSFRAIPVAVYVFSAVFVLRLIILTRLTESQFLLPNAGDMRFYNDWALRILNGHWTDHQAFYGLPLYPYFLAAIYKICGYSPFLPALLQAIAEGGTGALIYTLGVRVFGSNDRGGSVIGMVAAIGWTLFQPAQAYSVILMPTAWLVFVFWLVVWLLLRWKEPPPILMFLGLGVLIGFTSMAIATVLFLLPLVVLALFLKWRALKAQYRTLGITLLLLGIALGASPAWVHNTFIAGDPVFLSAHSGVNFWIGNNPQATGYPKFPPGLHASQSAMLRDSITVAEASAGHALKRSEVSAYWSQKAWHWISQHPLAWLKLLGTKVKNFWNAFQYDDLSIITALRDQSITTPGLRFGLVAAFAIPGMILAWRAAPLSRWITGAILLHMLSLLSVFVTERYRLAAAPGLLLFASFGLSSTWQNIACAHYRHVIFFLLILLASTAFVSLPQKDPTLWALDTYNSGLQALEVNDLSVARQKLDLAYAYSPENAEINFAEGNLRLTMGDRTAAKRFYFAALRLDSRHAGAFNNLGLIALDENQLDLAARFFRHAIEIVPGDAKTYYLLARAEAQAGHRVEAERAITRAIELDPQRAEFARFRQELTGSKP